jgi:putative tryptophan/tyrosine transport system substrate-binding protein
VSLLLVARLAILVSRPIAAYDEALAGLREGLGEAAQLEVLDMRGDVALGRQLARKIEDGGYTLCITVGPEASVVAKNETTHLPIVFLMVTGARALGLRTANVTGVTFDVLPEQQLELLQLLRKEAHRIGVLYDPRRFSTVVDDAARIASRAGVQLVPAPVDSATQVPAAFRRIQQSIDGLWLLPDSTVVNAESFKYLLLETMQRGQVLLAFSEDLVDRGALAALGPNYRQVGRQAAQLVKRLLGGGSPRTIPIQDAHGFVSVNLRTAELLRVTVPENVLKQAIKVVR